MNALDELLERGLAAQEAFEYEKALDCFRRGLEGARAEESQSTGVHPLKAVFLNNIARINLTLGKADLAQQSYDEIFQNATKIPQERELFRAWLGRGEIANLRGDYEEAYSCFQSANELAKWMKSDLDQALSLFHMANSLSRLGQIEEGVNCLKKSLEILLNLPEDRDRDRLLAAVRIQEGLERLREGKLPEAADFFGKALSLTEREPVCNERAEAFRFLGVVLTLRHEYKQGVQHYTEAIKIYKKMRYSLGIAKIYNSLGQLCLSLVRPEEALLYLEKGLNICQMLKAEAEAATLYGKLGNVHMLMENYTQAITYFCKDLELSQRFGSIRTRAYTQHNLGRSFIHKGETREAVAYLRESLSLFKQVDDELNTGKVCQDLCSAYINLGSLDEAEKLALEALQIFNKLGYKQEEAFAKTLLGVVERHRTNWETSEKWFQESLETLEPTSSYFYLAETYYEYGLLCMATRDSAKALTMFNASLRITRKAGLRAQTSRNLRIIERIDDLALINFLFQEPAGEQGEPGAVSSKS